MIKGPDKLIYEERLKELMCRAWLSRDQGEADRHLLHGLQWPTRECPTYQHSSFWTGKQRGDYIAQSSLWPMLSESTAWGRVQGQR